MCKLFALNFIIIHIYILDSEMNSLVLSHKCRTEPDVCLLSLLSSTMK